MDKLESLVAARKETSITNRSSCVVDRFCGETFSEAARHVVSNVIRITACVSSIYYVIGHFMAEGGITTYAKSTTKGKSEDEQQGVTMEAILKIKIRRHRGRRSIPEVLSL